MHQSGSMRGFDTINLDPYPRKQHHRSESPYDTTRRRTRKQLQNQYHNVKTQSSLRCLLFVLVTISLLFFGGLSFYKGISPRHDRKLSSSGNFGNNLDIIAPIAEQDAGLSVIVPTYKENDNIKRLCEVVFEAMQNGNIWGELLIMDDNSNDGSKDTVQDLIDQGYNISIYIRTKEPLGLSSAVLKGFDYARYDSMVVMDADLSHDEKLLPLLVKPMLKGDADFALASRYMKGGGTDGWPLKRRIISWGATMLASPLTRVYDPMSGFFGIRKSLYVGCKDDINSEGFKIGLELIVKCAPVSITEVPYTFKDRQIGESKLKIKTQVQYAIQVAKLLWFVYPLSFILFGIACLMIVVSYCVNRARGAKDVNKLERFG